MASQLTDQFMELMHDQSLPVIAALQQSFADSKDFMIGVSVLFDPRYVFLILAPILFAVNKAVGHRMIIALTLTEWSNQVLKWLLAGERPYWYVHERNQLAMSAFNSSQQTILNFGREQQYVPSPFPALEQFPVTCELGAGSPSGHAMVTATVWYILIDAFLKNELPVFGRLQAVTETYNPNSITKTTTSKQNEQASSQLLQTLSKPTWTAYALVLVLISLSRVYLACHFPHQCFCGALLGIAVARFVANKLPMNLLRQSYFVALTAFMFCTALTTYAILRSNGFNPMWTIDKATKWCVKKEYLHMDTTPFFSMMRYLGFCLGAGLAFNTAKYSDKCLSPSKKAEVSGLALIAQRVITAALAIYFGRVLLSIPLPNRNLNVFYGSSFVLYVIFSYAIARPVPKLAKILVKNALSTVASVRQARKSKIC